MPARPLPQEANLLPLRGDPPHDRDVESSAPAPSDPSDIWSVFVLRNPAGRCFVGHTEHLDQFALTADTEVAKWTGQPGPWPVVWRHDKLSRKAALKFEVSLKRDKNTPRFYTRTGLTPPDIESPGTPPPENKG